MKLPRWDCRNDEDQRLLEKWTLDQLDKLDNELVTERDLEAMEAISSDEYNPWSEEELWRQQQRSRVVKAAKAKDTRLLTRLIRNDPELQQLAVLVLTRGRGRPKGSRKTDIVTKKKRVISADIVGEERDSLVRAAADVPRIYALWQDKLGHRYRTQSPTPVEIAARRWRLKVKELRNFRKNNSAS